MARPGGGGREGRAAVGLPLQLRRGAGGCEAAAAGPGAYGLCLAPGLAAMAAVIASFTLLALRFDYRPRARIRMGLAFSAFRASAANYVANLFNILPIMALPLIVLNRRGPADATVGPGSSVANQLAAAHSRR